MDSQPQLKYPALGRSDEGLLDEIFAVLKQAVNPLADAYSEDGSYAKAIETLPLGLRAMAATHHLDVSLTLDDIGWHFLNFGEPEFVMQTEDGLRELGLGDLANWFKEAYSILKPLKAEIASADDYCEVLTSHGQMDRINELTEKARKLKPDLQGSPIYAAWIRYARQHPENVFEHRPS